MTHRLKTCRALAAATWLLVAGLAPAAVQDEKSASGFQFELLPRSFQKKPLVDVHVITEMTPTGRTQAPPTAAQPVWYATRAAGQLTLGLGSSSVDEKPADVAQLEELMASSLALSHYLPAREGQEAKLIIIYSWGSHSAPISQNDPGVNADGAADMGESREAMAREMIERAKLVGGEKFTKELITAMSEESAMRRAGISFGMLSPMEQFRNRNTKTMALLDDIAGSIYFVAASAYDAASVATNKRVLLWRTKMTTRASGLNLLESMPTLIATAGPYFGKDMAESESVRRRLDRDGTVELAPLQVLGVAEGTNQPGQERAPPATPPEPPKQN